MRRSTTCLLLLATVGAIAVGPTHAAEPREAEIDYKAEDVNHHVAVPGTGAGVWDTEYAYEFTLRRGERFVSVEVFDESEGPVAGAVVQWVTDYESNGASIGHAETFEQFCGKTKDPVRVIQKLPVEILLQKGTCQDGTPSVPTNGEIHMEFLRKR
jgi:hypothetical protein